MSLQRQRLLARFYDPFAAAGLREVAISARMLELVGPAPRRILHLGCGRGWLARTFARRYPGCEVIGVDADPDILAGAEDQQRRSASRVRYLLGRAEAPPVTGAFDAIVSSLLLHHLPRAAKVAAFGRAAELLAPGGRVLVADFGQPHDLVMRGAFLPVQLAHGFGDTADNLDGHYLVLMRAAGLVDAAELGRWRSPLGTVALYQARARALAA
ncbi:MAG TPA: class I SAM-dependent methyltransferase [Kofleriaceae bacterium]|nr:class I SAM-dependent methyltransferase [Kofleriaceae bacterium]